MRLSYKFEQQNSTESIEAIEAKFFAYLVDFRSILETEWFFANQNVLGPFHTHYRIFQHNFSHSTIG